MNSDTPPRVTERATECMSTAPTSGGVSGRTRTLLEALHRAGPGPYSAEDAGELWGMPPRQAGRRLRSLRDRGWVARSYAGLYVPVPLNASTSGDWTEDPWLLVARLFPTGYVGGWSACEHWGLTDQLFREVLVLTPQRGAARNAVLGGTPIRVKVIKSAKVFGVRTVWRRAMRVTVSDPTRTIVDILDDPALGGGIRHVSDVLASYFTGEYRNDALLIDYATRLGNRAVFKRLGYLIEVLGLAGPDLVEACHSRISRGISRLDPALGARGPIVTRWNLQINAAIDL